MVARIAYLGNGRGPVELSDDLDIPVFDKSQRSDGTFSRDDFAYDQSATATSALPAGQSVLAHGAAGAVGTELRQRQKSIECRTPSWIGTA